MADGDCRPERKERRGCGEGALEGFELTPDDANAIIMKARVAAGWIDQWPEAEEAPEETEAGEGEEGEAVAETAAETESEGEA